MNTNSIRPNHTIRLACAAVLVTSFCASAQYQAERLKSFGNLEESGAHPQARLIKDRDGIIYGTTREGGLTGSGTVFAWSETDQRMQVLHSFCDETDGSQPWAGVVEGPGGDLYGTASAGGANGGGTVFRVQKDGSRFRALHHFGDGEDGTQPAAELLVGSDGYLYGTTALGSSSEGTVFRLGPDGRGYQIIHTFTNTVEDGSSPYAALIEDRDGLLYGATYSGGPNQFGTVFRLQKDGSEFEVLHGFADDDGTYPMGDLCLGSDGRLYGTTEDGGKGGGVVFRLSRDGKDFLVLYAFLPDPPEGNCPEAGLVEGSDGRLYGVTGSGGSSNQGTIFALNKDGSGFTPLHELNQNAGDGGVPLATLLADGRGVLYGTCSEGSGGEGTLFRIQEDGSRFEVRWTFTYSGGDCLEPYANMVEGSDGAFYGTACFGGLWDEGGVFRINKNGGGYQLLHHFKSGDGDGQHPTAPLVEDADGVLYGTTGLGGQGSGTVFRMEKDGSRFKVLHPFAASGAEGGSPYAGLLEGSDGLLYGTTEGGGTSNRGTLFRLDKQGDNFSVVHHFTGGTNDGTAPKSGLVEDRGGVLYGCTTSGGNGGGNAGGGTLFKVEKNGAHFQILHHFAALGGDGSEPWATLLLVRNRTLFGTTRYEGYGNGIVFAINTDGSGYLVLHRFQGDQGSAPGSGGLVEGSDGALYGTAYNGGWHGAGSVFKVNADGTGFGILHHFINGTGSYGPEAGLLLGSDGVWYGTTVNGGEMGEGTIYRLRLAPPRFTSITRDTNACHLTIQGMSGFMYELQSTESLSPANWETRRTFETSDEGLGVLDDASAPQGTNRLYRVRWVPELLP